MARPLGPVRLKKTNPFTILIGIVLCMFIVYFLIFPSSSSTTSGTSSSSGSDSSSSQAKKQKPAADAQPLSPPTSPFRKQAQRSNSGQLMPPPVMRYNLNNVTTTGNPIENSESVLILTPMARFYQEYWDNLLKLTYPHSLINLAFILPKNKEGNAATTLLQAQVAKTQRGPEKSRFKSVTILRQDFEAPLQSQEEGERHKLANQKARREAMSKARNSLLFTTLGPSTSWVLWLDSDIVETPATLIQDLAKHDQPIVAPNCFQRFYNEEKKRMDERPYDFNNWQDSTTAQELASQMGPDDILLEGYAEMATYRALMAYMTTEDSDLGYEIPLDGVGGTALLVKADVHRDGAMFPPFPFYHLISTLR